MSRTKPSSLLSLLPSQLPSIIIFIRVWGARRMRKVVQTPWPSVWNWGEFGKLIPGLWRLSQRSQIGSLVFSTQKCERWKKLSLRASRVCVQIHMKLRKGIPKIPILSKKAEEPFYPSLSRRQGWVGCIRSELPLLPPVNRRLTLIFVVYGCIKGGLVDGPWIVEEVTILGARFNNPVTLGKPLPLSRSSWCISYKPACRIRIKWVGICESVLQTVKLFTNAKHA